VTLFALKIRAQTPEYLRRNVAVGTQYEGMVCRRRKSLCMLSVLKRTKAFWLIIHPVIDLGFVV